MASSFVKFKQNGFWVRDRFLEKIAGTLYIIIKDLANQDKWLEDFKELLLHNTLGNYPSYMHFKLDALVE